MSLGIFELAIGALLVVIALIWWLWPRDDRTDLTAPPKELGGHVSRPHDWVHKTGGTSAEPLPEPEPADDIAEPPPPPPTVAARARRGDVASEADYTEEELMIRDVRALLHRERKIEAVKRVRQTLDIDLKEALDFVESLDMPGGLDEIRYRDGRRKR